MGSWISSASADPKSDAQPVRCWEVPLADLQKHRHLIVQDPFLVEMVPYAVNYDFDPDYHQIETCFSHPVRSRSPIWKHLFLKGVHSLHLVWLTERQLSTLSPELKQRWTFIKNSGAGENTDTENSDVKSTDVKSTDTTSDHKSP